MSIGSCEPTVRDLSALKGKKTRPGSCMTSATLYCTSSVLKPVNCTISSTCGQMPPALTGRLSSIGPSDPSEAHFSQRSEPRMTPTRADEYESAESAVPRADWRISAFSADFLRLFTALSFFMPRTERPTIQFRGTFQDIAVYLKTVFYWGCGFLQSPEFGNLIFS